MHRLRLFPVLAGIFLLTQPAWGQLTIQSNPVFSTPVPGEQKLGPSSAPFHGNVLEVTPRPETSEPEKRQVFPDEMTTPGPIEESTLGEVELEPGSIVPPPAAGPVLKGVEIQGNRYFRTWAVKRYLAPILEQKGSPLNPETLENELKAINKFAPFKLQGKLAPTDSGWTDLRLNVYEQQPWQIVGTFDNQGRPGTGYYRGGTQVFNYNVLGFGDQLGVGYVGAEGARRFTMDWRLPLNARSGELGFQYAFQDVNYDKDLLPPGVFNLNGQDNVFILTLSQPIDKARRFTPYISTLFREVTIKRNGVEILSANPRPWTLGLRYNDTDKYGQTSLDLQPIIVGQHWFGGDSKFYRARAIAFRSFKLPQNNVLVLRGAWQTSGDELPLVQAIQVGGEYSVRGYTEGVLTGDRGHYYQLEHHWPAPFLNRISPWLADRLRGVTFLDFGQTWIDKSSVRFVGGVSSKFERTTIASIGLGARYRFTQNLQGFVDAGWGLFDRNRIELNSQPTARIHFGIRTELLPRPYRSVPTEPRML